MTILKNKPILLIDTREKKPFDFEGDTDFASVKFTKLDGGDYSLDGLENIIVIERKGSVDELFINFTQNKQRIFAEFDRLNNHKHKIIVIEESLDQIMLPNNYYVNKKKINKQNPKMPVAVVLGGLYDLLLDYNAQVIFAGSKAQSIVKAILLRAYKKYAK